MKEIDLWQQAARQRAHLTANAPDFILKAVEKAEMVDEHHHLDELLTLKEYPDNSFRRTDRVSSTSTKRGRKAGQAIR